MAKAAPPVDRALIDFLALEAPFLLPEAASVDDLRKAIRRISADPTPLWPGVTAADAAGWTRELLLEHIDGHLRRQELRASLTADERRAIAPRPPAAHEAHHGEHVHGVISAPMQGTILRVLVEPGQQVEAGDVVCILEAMKMENSIVAQRDGAVSELPIEPGQVVQTGQTLAVID